MLTLRMENLVVVVALTRKEVVYVGANDGMLHAFDSTTGEELWAFIPPTVASKI